MEDQAALWREAVADYEKEIVIDGFVFRRPTTENILALREMETDDKLNNIEFMGKVMSMCIDPSVFQPTERDPGLTFEQLGKVVVARGGFRGTFYKQVAELAGISVEVTQSPLESQDTSESPSENSDDSPEPSS